MRESTLEVQELIRRRRQSDLEDCSPKGGYSRNTNQDAGVLTMLAARIADMEREVRRKSRSKKPDRVTGRGATGPTITDPEASMWANGRASRGGALREGRPIHLDRSGVVAVGSAPSAGRPEVDLPVGQVPRCNPKANSRTWPPSRPQILGSWPLRGS